MAGNATIRWRGVDTTAINDSIFALLNPEGGISARATEAVGPLVQDETDIPVQAPDSAGGAEWWLGAAEMPAPETNSYGFSYWVTGRDGEAEPTLAARLRIGFGFGGDGRVRRVSRHSLEARLQVPIVDAATSQPATVELVGVVTPTGDSYECVVEITGRVARAIYGVLTTPQFQGDRVAQLAISSSFDAVKAVPRAAKPRTPPVDGGGERARKPWELEERYRENIQPWRETGIAKGVVIRREPIGALGAKVHDLVLDRPLVKELQLRRPGGMFGFRRHFGRELVPDITELWAIDLVAVRVRQEHTLPVFVSCRDHPDLYTERGADGTTTAIGCRDALSLGRVANRRFMPAPQHAVDGRFSVWESLQQPATFLVVPAHYRVARRDDGGPHLQWTQVFDATRDVNLPCHLRAQCVPDITPVEVAMLSQKLRQDRASSPTLLLPTSSAVGAQRLSIGACTLGQGVQAVQDNDTVRLALAVDYSDAVVTTSLLKGGEATAQLSFETGDPELALSTTVHLDVDELAGPYPTGPVHVVGDVVRNSADTTARVSSFLCRDGDGLWRQVDLGAPTVIAAGQTAPLPEPAQGAQLAEAQLDPADAGVITTRGVYLEDLHTTLLIRCDLDFATSKIGSIAMTFAIAGTQVAGVELPEPVPVYEVTLVQPLVADRAKFDRKVTVTAVVTDTSGDELPASTTSVDLSLGVIADLSDLVGRGAR